ncbi:hypothetical protein [Burkholderia phage FLC9]|nr:hypothetical protein [Burkholderia phage FLC9]
MAASSTLISLLDVALFVQRELALYKARKRNPRNPEVVLDPGWRNYDSSNFLLAILRDVFDNTCEDYPTEYLVQAKAILQNAGMDPRAAHELCNRTFDMVVIYISAQLPHLVFHDTSQRITADLLNTWDVVVTEYS